MVIFLCLLALVCVYQMRVSMLDKKTATIEGGIYSDYMSLEKTTSIKGIFILIVFLNHAIKYIALGSSILDTAYTKLISDYMGQSMVAMFMLYSGYGVMLSIDKKGQSYVKSIPAKRFLKVLVHFDIAILIFLAVGFALGKSYELKQVLLALVGWDSVGNSNWYIFVILCLYLITFISFILVGNSKPVGVAINFVLCCAFVVLLKGYKDVWWYDTVLCYNAGMFLYIFKPAIDKLLKGRAWLYWICLVAMLGVTAVSFKLSSILYILFIKHIAFALAIVLITMKFSINNKVLNFFGKHLFSVFILQRLPMSILAHLGLSNKYLFIILSLIITVALAIAFDYVMNKLDGLLFKPKKA